MRAPLRLSHVSRASALAMAGVYTAVILSTPAVAYAQAPAQPVPYNPAPSPVPYSQPAPASAPAGSAPAVGSDVIYMKNGGILRGTIIDAIPNAQARIELATGEIATVQWSEIARIERGEAPKGKPPGAPAQGSSLPPLPPTGPAPSPGAPPPPPAPTMVMVHIDGPEDTQLEQDVSHEEHWQTVCTAPCDLKLPIGPDYRVTGPGIKASGVFGLEYQNGLREIVTVNGASKSWFVLGIVSTAVGGAAALIGALVGLSASLVASVDSGNGDTAGQAERRQHRCGGVDRCRGGRGRGRRGNHLDRDQREDAHDPRIRQGRHVDAHCGCMASVARVEGIIALSRQRSLGTDGRSRNGPGLQRPVLTGYLRQRLASGPTTLPSASRICGTGSPSLSIIG